MIVVTGANGFVGEHLLRYLLQNTTVPILALHRSNQIPADLLQHTNITWQPCNLLHVDDVFTFLKNAQQVYHCANMVSFAGADADLLIENNVDTTANIVNACLANNVGKLLYVSSVAAICRESEKTAITEDTPWIQTDDTSVYGISKYKAEMEVWRGAAEGLCVAIVNPTIILGKGNWNKGSCALYKNAWKEFSYYTNGTNGFVDVQDVVRAMVLLMNSDVQNQRFIINAQNKTYQELFKDLAIALGKKPPTKLATSWMSNIVWRLYAIVSFFTKKPALITKETAATANSNYFYNNQKFLQQFPNFAYTDWQKSMQENCKWYQQKYK